MNGREYSLTTRRSPIAFGTILLVLITLFFIEVGCNRNGNSLNQSDTLEKVRSSKELNVGYFIFEPTIMEDPNTGERTGCFIDMVESIAKSLDAKVIYHKIDLANFAAGLQSRQFDLCIGATFATPQRATAVLFTRPLFYSGYTGVAPKGKAASYSTWQDLDRQNLRVAVKQGSAIDDFVRDNFMHAEVVRLTGPDLTLPLAAVSAGQADVGLMNQQTVFTYLRAHPELEEVLPKTPIAPTNFSWSVRPDDLRWLHFVNTALEYMENTGEMYRYESKYGMPLLHAKQEFVVPEAAQPSYWTAQPGSKGK